MSLLLFALALLAIPPPTAGAQNPSSPVTVGDGVRDAIGESGAARVVIAFRATAPSFPESKPAREAPVETRKSRALGLLSPGEFQVLWSWDALPEAAAGRLTASGLARLEQNPDVLRIDLDAPGGGNLSESVPLIRGDRVHARGLTGRGVTVAILDSGLTTAHPDLSDDLIDEHCFCVLASGAGCCHNGQTEQAGAGSAEDDNGHGTNVAGIVTSAGRIAPTGVAPDAKIVMVKVLDSGNSFSGTSQVVSGLNWILQNRPEVKVVNMSLGTNVRFVGTCDSASSFTLAFAQAIGALKSRGVTVFVSSGNDRSITDLEAPACISSAVAVGAVYDADFGTFSGFFGCSEPTAPDRVTCFSNSTADVRLFAPGAAITSTGMGGGRSTYFGTSQASPHAAGVAALLLQADPTLTPAQIEAALTQTGVPVTDPRNQLTFPRVDAMAAVDSVLLPVVAFTATPISPSPGQPVVFADASTRGPTAWSWSFGDGTVSSVRSPVHAFAVSGTYRITLSVTNSWGTATLSRVVIVAEARGIPSKAAPKFPRTPRKIDSRT